MWTKEKRKQYQKEWYLKNKEKRSLQIKEYAKNHKKDSVKRVQKYVKNNIEKVKNYRKSFEQSVSGKYRLLIYRAKHYSGTPITIEEFSVLILLPCNYCGDTGKVGIDRVDNSIGYTKENSVACCKDCNFMKKTMSVEKFLKHTEKIYLHNIK